MLKYRGVKYDTPLEARWAAFFHHLGWDYTYDPFGEGVLTFMLQWPERDPVFVRVTEAATEADYWIACVGLDPALETVVVGVSPKPRVLSTTLAPVGLLVYGDDRARLARWRTDTDTGGLCWAEGGAMPLFRRGGEVRDAWVKATNDVRGVTV